MIKTILKTKYNLILSVLIFILLAFIFHNGTPSEKGRPASSEETKKMLEAFKKNDFPSMKAMIDAGINLNSVRLEDRRTLLTRSVSMCDKDMVQFLLENGAKVNLGNYGSHALNSYYYCGKDILLLLAAYGARIDKDSGDILFHNEIGDSFEFMLLMGADIHKENFQGRNLLSEAAKNGRIKEVRYFLRHGVSSSARDQDGKSALDYALLNDRSGIAEEIIQYDFDSKYFARMELLKFYNDENAYLFPNYSEIPLEVTENQTKESDFKKKGLTYSTYKYMKPVIKRIGSKEFRYDTIYHSKYLNGKDHNDKKYTVQTVFFLNSTAQFVHSYSYYLKHINCRETGCGFKDCDYPEPWKGYREDKNEYDNQKLQAFRM